MEICHYLQCEHTTKLHPLYVTIANKKRIVCCGIIYKTHSYVIFIISITHVHCPIGVNHVLLSLETLIQNLKHE